MARIPDASRITHPNSRLPGFNKLSMAERRRKIAALSDLTDDEISVLSYEGGLPSDVANRMIENAVGTFELPLGIGTNFTINGRDYLIPMAVEEPSVVAAVSLAARIVRESGGFTAETDESIMAAQIQIAGYGDVERARSALMGARDELIREANALQPQLVERGGGAREIELRVLPAPEGPSGEDILVLHVLIDTREAMGANLVNTIAEGLAPTVERLTHGKVYLRILSNLADRRLARARCSVPVAMLADFGVDGEVVREGIIQASRFAQADPYRAATHNKGVMNGIDAVAIATGNDWRAIEAGAHAYASRSGRYSPLSVWTSVGDRLFGTIELPLAVGTIGGTMRVHPAARVALKVMRVSSGRELAGVMAAVGLAQNMAALRALGTIGIQRGHMALHARSVAMNAGASGEWVERVAGMLVRGGRVNVDRAREFLAQLRSDPSEPTPVVET